MDDKEKKERQREASRRWRANHPDQAKQVGRNHYHRQQAKLGLESKEREIRTPEERKTRKLLNSRQRTKKWQQSHPEYVKAKTAENYAKNREKHIKKATQWYYDNKERTLARLQTYHLKRLYGLTPEGLKALGKTCHICGTDKNQSRYRMHVDHDHKTGIVRGLLCHSCNLGLGGFRDDPLILMKAIAYLSKNVKEVS